MKILVHLRFIEILKVVLDIENLEVWIFFFKAAVENLIRLFIFQTQNMNQKVSSWSQEHFIYTKYTIWQSFKIRGTEIKENDNNKSVNYHLYSRCLSMSHYFHLRIIFWKRSSERVTGDRTRGGKNLCFGHEWWRFEKLKVAHHDIAHYIS